MKIIKWLEETHFVREFHVLEYKIFADGFYIKIKTELADESSLFIREYSDAYERNYSYHWQSQDGNIICRWDNAPHCPNLINFPHHKHDGGSILPSEEMTLKDVLRIISSSFDE